MLILFLLLINPVYSKVADEYKLKAVFIERFFRFIEYTPNAKIPDTVNFGIIGNDDISEPLINFFKNKKINNIPINLTIVKKISQLSKLNIVFISKKSSWTTKDICKSVGKNTLIIGDLPKMVENGAIISFMVEKGFLRFRINTNNAEKNNIKISSYLLEMADIVNDSILNGEEK